jgi:hypothetical protein
LRFKWGTDTQIKIFLPAGKITYSCEYIHPIWPYSHFYAIGGILIRKYVCEDFFHSPKLIVMKKLFSIAATILAIASGYSQGRQTIFSEINQLKSSGAIPKEMQIVNFLSSKVDQIGHDLKGLNKGTIVSLSKDDMEALLLNRNDFIQIHLPVDDQREMILTLKRNQIFTNEFMLNTSSDRGNPVTYTPGVHYKGIVDGEPSSVVALSVFNDQVMGMIATDQGNFVIGRIKDDPGNRHIFYNEKDLDRHFEFECQTPDGGPGYTKDQLENKLSIIEDANDCVRLYVEINNDIVTDKGGVVPATDFVTGLYNQAFTIFANESINMMINQIFAWTSPSPYHSGTAQQKLAAYGANTHFFNGDLSQLLGYSNDGVAGSLNGICNVDPDMSKCYSGIHPIATNQSIIFICHELGHLLGSRHTHACVWNGNNTAIDGCATVEGSCAQLPPAPDWTGTLMSYCFPAFDSYDGFGPQPGNVIRNTVNASGNCLTPCGPPTSYCLSYGLVSNNKYIKKVVLGSISNQTGNNNGYGNYLSLSTNLTAGNTYTISMTPGSNGSTKYWRVWIDYNGDNDWNDAGELVGQKSGSQVVSFAFTVPSGASLISTRMRVSMAYNAYAANCGSFSTGEVEDYKVNILPAQGAKTSITLDQITESRQLNAYPNPASNQITIQNSNNKMLGTISIYDLSGKMIYKNFVGSSQTIIDLKNFSSGVYYLRSDQMVIALKFVKQ